MILIMFVAAGTSLSAAAEPTEVTIPSEYGEIVSYVQAGDPVKPLLVLIQDAHAQYGAQKSLIEILRHLVLTHGLRYILVEGGAGDVDLSHLRRGIPLDHVKDVAGRYLREGKIAGEEYLDLVLEDREIELWGVENRRLYKENMQAFLDFREGQSKALQALRRTRRSIEKLKKKYYPAPLQELDHLRQEADRDPRVLEQYFKHLIRLMPDAGVDLKDYPVFKQWIRMGEEGNSVDESKVEYEKNTLLKALTRKATKEEMYEIDLLIRQSAQETEVLKKFLELKNEYDDILGPYMVQNIEKRLAWLEKFRNLDGPALFRESHDIFRRLRADGLVTEAGKNVACADDYAELEEKLLRLEWTPDDKKSSLHLEGKCKRAFDHVLTRTRDRTEYEAWRPKARSFYRVSLKREKAIFKNTLRFMKTRKASLYVLIVGGFHAEALAQMFEEKKVPVMNILPQFALSGESGRYFEILLEKWGDGAGWDKKSDKIEFHNNS